MVSLPAATPPPVSFFPIRTVWTERLSGQLSAPPGFRDSLGYFPMADSHLAAWDLTIGRQLWVAEADVHSKPAADDQLIFIAESDALVALSAADGSRAWRVTLDAADRALATPLVWDNGWLIAATESGAIIGFRASDGHLIWRHNLGSPLRAPPALAADRVYLPAGDGRIVALQVETGAKVWEHRLGGPPSDVLALDDRLYVGSLDNFFYCLLAKDGRVAWRFPTGGDVIGLPLVDDRRVYFSSLDNILRALDRRSGSQQWRRALPLRPTRGPLQLARTLIVSGSGPTLHAYLAQDGQPAGDLPAGAALMGTPHVVTEPLLLVLVTTDLTNGAVITAIGHKEKEEEADQR